MYKKERSLIMVGTRKWSIHVGTKVGGKWGNFVLTTWHKKVEWCGWLSAEGRDNQTRDAHTNSDNEYIYSTTYSVDALKKIIIKKLWLIKKNVSR